MLVLFDIGSTLIEGPSEGPGKRLAKKLGLDSIALKQLNQFLFESPLRTPYELSEYLITNFGIPLKKAEHIANDLWESQINSAWVLPGAKEIIQQLDHFQIKRAYISNIWAPFYEGFKVAFKSEASNSPVFLSYEMGLSKPSLEFYKSALDILKVPAKDIVMIGDTYQNDILPAQRLGLKTIWVLHRPEKEKEDILNVINGVSPPPNLTIDTIAHLSIEDLRSLISYS